MTIIEKIKAKIEILRANTSEFNYQNAVGYNWALDDVLSFLSTLESEKPMNMDEELNEEIKKEMVKLPFFIRGKDQIAFARHFAQWGTEYLKK